MMKIVRARDSGARGLAGINGTGPDTSKNRRCLRVWSGNRYRSARGRIALFCHVSENFCSCKGGELSPGWQVLAVSFLIFSLGQLLSLAIKLEIVTVQKNAISILQLLALILVAVGVTKIKKSLT